MAWHMKLKLPSFKMTQRSGGSTTHMHVPRGQVKNQSPVVREDLDEDEGGNYDVDDPPAMAKPSAEPSMHYIKQISSTAAWESVREALRNVAVECSIMPIGQECILCPALATYRCTECAAWAYYCPQCFGDVHSKVGIYHTGEVWQVHIRVLCYNYVH